MVGKTISVIIPVYNREKYIHKCIESVLEQKNVSTEIILVDDGSTDKSLEICNRFSMEFENIKVFHTENCGVSHARNVGLDNAAGDYILFLDSDDRLAPDVLEVVLGTIVEYDADYIIGSYEFYSDDGENIYKISIPEKFLYHNLDSNSVLDIMSEGDCRLVINVTGKLFKASLWEKLRFSDKYKIAEDDSMLPKILDNSKSIHAIDNVVYYITTSEKSLMRSAPSINLLDATKSNLEVVEYCIKRGNIKAALFRFGFGTRKFLEARKVLLTEEAKKEIEKQYKQYCDISKEMTPYVGLKNRIRFALFRINLDLYDKARRFAS